MPNAPLHSHLRQSTRAIHEALDASVGPFDTVAGYRRYLANLAAFRIPVERALAQSSAPAGWNLQSLGPVIAQDFRDVSGEDLPQRSPLAAQLRMPATPDIGWWAGTLYVLEGSTVGARLLLRRAEALGLGAGHGARHLALQTADRIRWPRFLALLEALDADRDSAASAAGSAFALALEAFTGARKVDHTICPEFLS